MSLSKKKYISFIKNEYYGKRLSSLEGNVLEIGFGKGDNFRYYNNKANVTAIDPKEKTINKKNRNENINTVFTKLQDYQFRSKSIDYIVGSFVLCSVRDKKNFFNEADRILSDKGRLIFLEHTASENPFIKTLQNIFSLVFKTISISCRPNNKPLDIVPKNKFNIVYTENFNDSQEPYVFFELEKIK